MAMMIVLAFFISVVTYAAAQKGCSYTHDDTSPFFWKQEKNLCTDEICKQRQLNCIYPAEDINDAVLAHQLTTGENIMYEIGILERTFNATFPDEYYGSTADYTCQGVCERPVKRLERIFYDYPQKDKMGNAYTSRQLCFVVGPQIRYSPCSGKPCNIKGIMSGAEAYNCVPDVTTTLTVWLYCPDIMPQCVKTTLEIPISCSCARFQCPTKIDPLSSPMGGQGMTNLFGGADLFAGLKGPDPVPLGPALPPLGPASPVDPFGASQPFDILSGGGVDPSLFQPIDIQVPGQDPMQLG